MMMDYNRSNDDDDDDDDDCDYDDDHVKSSVRDVTNISPDIHTEDPVIGDFRAFLWNYYCSINT